MFSVCGRQQENRFQSEINFILSILDIDLDNKKIHKKDVLLRTSLKAPSVSIPRKESSYSLTSQTGYVRRLWRRKKSAV